MKKLLLSLLVVIVLLVGGFFLKKCLIDVDNNTDDRNDPPISKSHPALKWFTQTYKNRSVIFGFSGDLTNDGLEDVIIIYKENNNKNYCWVTVAVKTIDDGWYIIDPVLAPKQNQKVKVFDMDNSPPSEFTISGDKNGIVGYAVFRIIDGRLESLIDEGYLSCCE